MKISIITVCFNSENTIRDTIQSVLNQSYRNIEYIVVDGASTDRTLRIIEEYRDRIKEVISAPDKGIYDAMNKGVSLATGDVIGILNSDDFFENSFSVESVANHFSIEPNDDIVFGSVVFVKQDNIQRIIRYYSIGYFQPWMLRFGWMPPHPATFIKRKIYKEFGMYSTDYKISADYEMFVRLLLVNRLKFSYMNKILVRMRAGGTSNRTLRNRFLLNQEIVKACRSNGIYTNLIFVLSKIPLKLIEFFRKPKRDLL